MICAVDLYQILAGPRAFLVAFAPLALALLVLPETPRQTVSALDKGSVARRQAVIRVYTIKTDHLTIQYSAYRDQPERIPDHAALDSVAEILAEVCWLKSEHLETNWQDANIAKIALYSLSKADTQTITSPQTRSNPSPHESVPSDQGRRYFLRFFRGIAACLLDSSPYQQISRCRECSVVFTSSCPLVYRHSVKNPFIPGQAHD